MATLKELDSWGVMDALDTYGVLDQLDNLVLHTTSSSVNLAVTTLTELQRVLQFAGSITGAGSVAAVITPMGAKMLTNNCRIRSYNRALTRLFCGVRLMANLMQ